MTTDRTSDGKITTVKIRGTSPLPSFLKSIPKDIEDWVETNKYVSADFTVSKMVVISTGVAKRSDGDEDDPVLGERLAECRAKLNLYRFMHNFISRLLNHYILVSFGNANIDNINIHPSDDSLINASMKYSHLHALELLHLKKLLSDESDTEGSPEH